MTMTYHPPSTVTAALRAEVLRRTLMVPAQWVRQTDEDRGDLSCAADLWVEANDPTHDCDPEDRVLFLDTVRWIGGEIAERMTRMLAEMAPRPPTVYCDTCRAWCRIPHDDCIGVPLWVRMTSVGRLGMSIPAIDRALRSGTLVYDPEASAIRFKEAIADAS